MKTGVKVKNGAKAMKGIDVAALLGAIVAVTLTIVMTPGRYDLAEVAIGLTVALVLSAFILGRRRTLLEGVAVSAVCGLSLLPVGGFLVELFLHRAAGPKTQFWIWLIASGVAWIVDRRLGRGGKISSKKMEPTPAT